MRIHEFTLCAELPSASQGDVCVLSEDCLSSGEAGGQPAHLPQLLLPLLTLQHKAQVRTSQNEKMSSTKQGVADLAGEDLCLKGQFTPKSKQHIFVSGVC